MKKEDRQSILDWVDRTGADGQTRDKIKGILDDVDALDVLGAVDVENALKQTRKKIKDRNEKSRKVLWGLAGAVVAAACSAIFFFVGVSVHDIREPLYSELKVNPGMTGTFVMPDSTVVVLNGGSKLTYTSGYGGRSREVSLVGEAYFDVTCNHASPFVVHTPSDACVTVYGTRFNVDAYSGNDCKVTLVEGSVGFGYAGKSGRIHEVMIEPGQRLVYGKDNDYVRISDVSVKADIAWKDGKIILDGTPLPEILDELSKRYSVKFDVRNDSYLDYTYSGGAFTIFSLEKVLETLQYTSSFDWKYDDTTDADRAPVIIIY